MQNPVPLRASLLLGVATGLVEVAIQAEPRLGLGFAEQLTWMTLAACAGMAVAAFGHALGLAARRLPGRWGPWAGKPGGVALAALLAMHAGVAWRFGLVLNLPLRHPKVLLGALLIGLSGLLLGLGLRRLVFRNARLIGFIAVFAFWIGLYRGAPPRGHAAGDGPNVLLISWDTARPDRLGPYGGPAATPTLDRLAAEGVVFEQAISTAPLTEPAHLSMLTGLRTTETGVQVNGTALGHRPELLQHAFQAAGASTGAVVAGFPLHARWGWDQGFDVYDDDFGLLPGVSRLSAYRLLEQLIWRNTARERSGDRVIPRAQRFLQRYGAGRWFLFVHLYDPHGPYEAAPIEDAPRGGAALDLPPFWPARHRSITSTDYLVRAYDQELSFADALTGQLLDSLDAMGLTENTLVLLTADHGESLTEHGELFDHGRTLYDPSLRVPLILRLPEAKGAGGRVACQVSLIDVAPTLADAAGLPRPAGDGRSLVGPALGAPCESRPVVATAPGERQADPPIDVALRTPAMKLIRYAAREDTPGHEVLYQLGPDPGELSPVTSGPGLQRAAQELDAALGGAVGTVAPSVDVEAVEALRALGYIE